MSTRAADEAPTLETPMAGAPEVLPVGTRLGRYLILQPLASGGVGAVYTAYDPQLDRKVALKVLRSELVRDETQVEWRGRLLREAHALARLSHPNVVTIHDAGLWAGELFLAMELLEGQTLRDLLDGPVRPWREVLPLLAAAGRGLAAAHAAGLVHRDVKPSNVLVTTAGRACVVDFGLARPAHEPWRKGEDAALPASAADSVAVTRLGHVPGTPGYMSPEQCRGEPVDPRSDQFSFCVTLYEALCGRRPFPGYDFQSFAEGYDRGTPALPMGAEVPAWLSRAVLRGLSLRPEDRWPSMDALLEALEKDPGAARRRRLRIAAGAGAAAALVAAVGLSAMQKAAACKRAPERWAQAWSPARAQGVQEAFLATGRPYAAASFERVSAGMDAYGQGWTAMYREACEATRVRAEQSQELMDLRMDCLRRQLGSAAALGAVLDRADDEVVANAATAVAALPALDACADARALLEGEPRPRAPEAVEAMERAQAEVAEARALYEAGKFMQGMAPAKAAVEHADATGRPSLRFEALEALTRLQLRAADYQDAPPNAQAAARAALASGDVRLQARGWILLMAALGPRLHRFEEANLYAGYAEASLARAGSTALEAQYFHALAQLRSQEARYPESVAAAERALAAEEKLPARNEVRAAQVLTTLAWSEGYLGRRAEALAHLDRAHQALGRALGASHPTTLRTRSAHAMALVDVGRMDEALVELRGALVDCVAVFGLDHPTTASLQSNMGEVLGRLGRYEEARPLVKDALAEMERKLGKDHRRLASFLDNVASVELGAGHLEEALEASRRALQVHGDDGTPATRDPDLANDLTGLGKVLSRLGRTQEAVAALSRAVELDRALGVLPEDLGEAEQALGLALWARGGAEERARALLTDAREQFIKAGAKTARELVAVDAWLDRHPAAPGTR